MRRLALSLVFALLIGNTCSGGELFLLSRVVDKHEVAPHAGVVVKYDDGKVEWWHFGVKDIEASRAKALLRQWVPGSTRRTEFPVGRLVGFKIDDAVLKKAVTEMSSEFGDADYKLGLNGRDCVTFATKFCVKVGLDTSRDEDYGTPLTMIKAVAFRNSNRISTPEVSNVEKLKEYVLPWLK